MLALNAPIYHTIPRYTTPFCNIPPHVLIYHAMPRYTTPFHRPIRTAPTFIPHPTTPGPPTPQPHGAAPRRADPSRASRARGAGLRGGSAAEPRA